MMYGLVDLFLGMFESVLISLSTLFILTLLDIYSIKRIDKSYTTLVHTITYFAISLILIVILNSFVFRYPFLLSFEVLIFIIMQFYTNYSLFTSLKLFYPKKEEVFKKIELNIRRLLGAAFYSTICLFVLQALVLQNFELQLIFLILSLIVHVLMILDSQLLKFLPKINNYIKVISWISIMAFTSTYLIWIFSTYFISFILTHNNV